jgi:hypothetical protein
MALDSASQLGKVIGNLNNEQKALKGAINPNASNNQTFRVFTENIIVEHGPLQITKRDISTDTIWGNNFIWGTSNWDDTYNNEPAVFAVHNQSNIFRERFNTTRYCDTSNTTANILTAGQISFGDANMYTSEVIAWEIEDTSSYKQIDTVTLNAFGDNADNLTFQARTDTNPWATVQQGIKTNITPGEKLYYRVYNYDFDNSQNLIAEDGDTLVTEDDNSLVTEFTTAGPATITYLKIAYTTV